jgi:hypothetical protein
MMGNIISAITGAIGNLFGGGGGAKAPSVSAMPDPGSAAAKIAAMKKVGAKAKSGRDGTIYSGDGSGSYSGSNLGGTA